MGISETLDLVIRDRRSGSVLLASGTGLERDAVRLAGALQLRPEPDAEDLLEVPVEAVLINDERLSLVERDPAGMRFSDGQQPIGPLIRDYDSRSTGDGSYEIHTARIGDDVDAFAVTDPVEIVLGAMVLGACLVRSGIDLFIVNKTLDIYREQGYVPKIAMKSGFKSAVTCQFDITIDAVDPGSREVVESKTIRVGRKGKK